MSVISAIKPKASQQKKHVIKTNLSFLHFNHVFRTVDRTLQLKTTQTSS